MGTYYIRKRYLIILAACFLFFTTAFLPAQTAVELEAILETQALSSGQAAYFVLASLNDSSTWSNEFAIASSPEKAFELAMSNRWFRKGTTPDKKITLGTLSFLMMKAFGIKGGMMYSLLPGPHYSYRTMVSRSLIQGTADPAMNVSGERFLLILGNVLDAVGVEQ